MLFVVVHDAVEIVEFKGELLVMTSALKSVSGFDENRHLLVEFVISGL